MCIALDFICQERNPWLQPGNSLVMILVFEDHVCNVCSY